MLLVLISCLSSVGAMEDPRCELQASCQPGQLVPHPWECHLYHLCVEDGRPDLAIQRCPQRHYFHPISRSCLQEDIPCVPQCPHVCPCPLLHQGGLTLDNHACRPGQRFHIDTGRCIDTSCLKFCSDGTKFPPPLALDSTRISRIVISNADSCSFSCNGDFSKFADHYDCTLYYECYPGDVVMPMHCPDSKPYFNGEDCTSNSQACCSDMTTTTTVTTTTNIVITTPDSTVTTPTPQPITTTTSPTTASTTTSTTTTSPTTASTTTSTTTTSPTTASTTTSTTTTSPTTASTTTSTTTTSPTTASTTTSTTTTSPTTASTTTSTTTTSPTTASITSTTTTSPTTASTTTSTTTTSPMTASTTASTTTTSTTATSTTTTSPTTKSTTTTSTTTLPTPTTSPSMGCLPEPDCSDKPPGAMEADPHNCLGYYVCLGSGNIYETPLTCPDGYYYNPTDHKCQQIVDGTYPCPQACDAICPYTCSDSDRIYDPLDCSKYYFCYEGSPLHMSCPNQTPYFNGTSCTTNSDSCCSYPCPPYCPKKGKWVPHGQDCHKYYICIEVGTPSDDSLLTCPDSQVYDYKVSHCSPTAECVKLC
ncbi:hypothetical protein OTU49_016255 [Cherax quadricarinatus]|uniref:Chitin-binding type-2 domain-containing protein n=1 Tax=Cherax quadricarinatus TaxID=27406 RepID=A0AAW0Y8C0_CHEQU|nr:spore coat protein SP65-like [Cherax quadricarinatus]